MGHGALVCTRTVSESTISTWLSGAKGGEPRILFLGSTRRSRLNLTASASTGSPLWNFMPGRSLNSHIVGEARHLAGESGLHLEIGVALEEGVEDVPADIPRRCLLVVHGIERGGIHALC